jgi:hypothetical protein
LPPFERGVCAVTTVTLSAQHLFHVDLGLESGRTIVSVQSESLEVLEKAELAPAQARAIVRAIEIEITGAKDTLATKNDLVLLRQDLHEIASSITRQMYRAVLGQLAVLLGFTYFFATHLR